MPDPKKTSLPVIAGILAVGLAGVGFLFWRRYDPAIVLYAALVTAIWGSVAVAVLRRTSLANPLLAATVVLAMFAMLDLAATRLLATPATTPTPSITVDGKEHVFYLRDPDLGYAPRPNTVAEATETSGGKLLYQVRYSIDGDGFRLTHGSADPAADTVVFVGCSVTFGDGLDDAQTLPEQFSGLKAGRLRVINAGFSGYGTHQVLKSLEAGRFDGKLGNGRRVFVYSAIADHLSRVVGGRDWDVWGPGYRLDGGSLRFTGPFHSELGGNVLKLIQRDALFSLVRRAMPPRESKEAAVALFAALTAQARTVARNRYHAEFVVVLWDVTSPDDDPAAGIDRLGMAAALNRAGVPVLPVSRLVPDLAGNASQYLIAGDGHPTGRMNRQIAGGLAELY